MQKYNLALFMFITLSLSWAQQNTLGKGNILPEVNNYRLCEYAPGQIIIKFKENSVVGEVADVLVENNQKLSTVSDNPVMDRVLKKYKVNKFQKLNKIKSHKKNIGKKWVTKKMAQDLHAATLQQYRQKNRKSGGDAESDQNGGYSENKYIAYFSDLETSLDQVITELSEDTNVEYAIKNPLGTVDMIPADERYSEQWSHLRTNIESAWDIERGSRDVVIAVVDVGVDYTHPDLAANIWRGFSNNPGSDFVDVDFAAYSNAGYYMHPDEDYTDCDDDPMAFHGHGTHCAGIVGAISDNNGIAGVCHNCRIMPIRVGFQVGNKGKLELDDVEAGIRWAADNGADIISMSFGFQGLSAYEISEFKAAIDYAANKGVFLVASAGNDGRDLVQYPAYFDNVMAVASTGYEDMKVSTSNCGHWVDISAPGGNGVDETSILSTVPFTGGMMTDASGYATAHGTSMACPYIAGVAGLIKSFYPSISPSEIRGRLMAGAENVLSGYFQKAALVGAGRVNVLNSLTSQERPFCKIRSTQILDENDNETLVLPLNSTAKLIVEIENVWTNAQSVVGFISTALTEITLSTSQIDFGSVSMGGTSSNAALPVSIDISDFEFEGYERTFEIFLNLNAAGFIQENSIFITVGKPVNIVESSTSVTSNADISGHVFTYAEIDPDLENKLVKSFNAVTGEKTLISTYSEYSNKVEGAFLPKISFHNIVWNDSRNPNPGQTLPPFSWDIYRYDLLTKMESVVDDGIGFQYQPDISGNKVIWANLENPVEDPNQIFDIWGLDIKTGQKSPISLNNSRQLHSAVYGNIVVWWDNRDGATDRDGDIYMYDGIGETPICTAPDQQTHPQVFKNYVVWTDNRNGNGDIYMYNIQTGEETPICTNPAKQSTPYIYGNTIVWSDYRNTEFFSDIYMYDIRTGKETQLTAGTWSQTAPRVNANMITWCDSRSRNLQVHYVEIENENIGQINDDGTVCIIDALLIVQFLNGILELDEMQWENADVTVDGFVSIHDAQVIGAYYVGLIPTIKNRLKIGDINNDGAIDMDDVNLLSNPSALTQLQQIAANVSGDTKVDMYDFQILQDYVNGVISEFPYVRK